MPLGSVNHRASGNREKPRKSCAVGVRAACSTTGAQMLGNRTAVRQMPGSSSAGASGPGGNYNCGLISGMYVVGDRNAQSQGLGNFMDFPMDADFASMYRNIRGISGSVAAPSGTGLAAGPRPNG